MISKENIKKLTLSTIAAVFVMTFGTFFTNGVSAQEIMVKSLMFGNVERNIFDVLAPRISTTIVISELRTRGPSGASDEFIEIYNNSDSAVDISGYKLNASNAAGTTSTRATVPANVVLPPRTRYLIFNSTASTGYSGTTPGNLAFTTGITDDGGAAILTPTDTVIDAVGFSTGSAYKEGTTLTPLAASTNNQSYERKPGGTATVLTDTDVNSSDFQLLTTTANPQNLVLTASPTALNFGNVNTGATSSLTVTIRNILARTVTLNTPTITGINSSEFSAGAPSTITLAAGATSTITVTFAPATAGTKTAQLNVTSNNGGSVIIPLSGTGAATNNAPTITAASPSVVKGATTNAVAIAGVTDDGGDGNVTVTISGSNSVNGVTVSNIVNTGGAITADVTTTCAATAASFTLSATDGVNTPVTTTLTVNVTDSTTATALAFGQQPTDTTAGSTIAPAVTVRAVNNCGVLVSSYNGSVTIALNGGGTLSGTTTATATNGVATFNNLVVNGSAGQRTLTATASGLTTATSNPFNVNAPTITVAPAALPDGTVGTAYSQTITATGGAPNYTFAVTGGALPTGLTLSSGGVLDGTPTAAGTFNFTVTATDLNGFTGSRAYSVTINAGDATAPVIAYTPLPAKTSEGTSTLIVTVTDNVAVQSVSIVYAIGGAATTANCPVSGSNTYSCQISETGASGQTISYYVTATDASNNSSSLPAASAPNGYAVGNIAVQGGTYTNLNINGGALGGAVTVLGTFSFNNLLGGGGNTLRIGCDGQIIRGATSAVIDGTVRKDLCAPQTFVFPVGTPTQISARGNINTALYTPVTAVVTAATNASSLTVSVTDDFMPGSNPGSSVSRYWSLTETGSITADLSFTYDQTDVNGTEATYKVIKNASGTTSIFNDSTNDAVMNTATVVGISDFSLWSVGALAPTAATADISGAIRNVRGRPLEYVNVTLSGGSLDEPITFTTDISGRFRFTEIPANETYILTVRSKRYRFSQPTQVFSVNGNLTNVSFVSEN